MVPAFIITPFECYGSLSTSEDIDRDVPFHVDRHFTTLGEFTRSSVYTNLVVDRIICEGRVGHLSHKSKLRHLRWCSIAVEVPDLIFKPIPVLPVLNPSVHIKDGFRKGVGVNVQNSEGRVILNKVIDVFRYPADHNGPLCIDGGCMSIYH